MSQMDLVSAIGTNTVFQDTTTPRKQNKANPNACDHIFTGKGAGKVFSVRCNVMVLWRVGSLTKLIVEVKYTLCTLDIGV